MLFEVITAYTATQTPVANQNMVQAYHSAGSHLQPHSGQVFGLVGLSPLQPSQACGPWTSCPPAEGILWLKRISGAKSVCVDVLRRLLRRAEPLLPPVHVVA